MRCHVRCRNDCQCRPLPPDVNHSFWGLATDRRIRSTARPTRGPKPHNEYVDLPSDAAALARILARSPDAVDTCRANDRRGNKYQRGRLGLSSRSDGTRTSDVPQRLISFAYCHESPDPITTKELRRRASPYLSRDSTCPEHVFAERIRRPTIPTRLGVPRRQSRWRYDRPCQPRDSGDHGRRSADQPPSPSTTGQSNFVILAIPSIPLLAKGTFHHHDDLAFCASLFDVGHRLVGRFKRKGPVQDGPDDPGIDERSDFAQLVSVGSHEQKRMAHAMSSCFLSDSIAKYAHNLFQDPGQSKRFRKIGIRRAGDRDQLSAGLQDLE
jgi:hypothetical protein